MNISVPTDISCDLKDIFRIPKDISSVPKNIHVPQRGISGVERWSITEGRAGFSA